jgi:hypothetical protein
MEKIAYPAWSRKKWSMVHGKEHIGIEASAAFLNKTME